MINKQDKCPLCSEPAISVYTENHEVRWGKYTQYGEQVLYIDDIHFKCIQCDFEYYTSGQSRWYESKINEQLKEKIGFDWLEDCRIRRAKRKEQQEIEDQEVQLELDKRYGKN